MRFRHPFVLTLVYALFTSTPSASASACRPLKPWLANHAAIASAMVWETPDHIRAWPEWSPRDQDLLVQEFTLACRRIRRDSSGTLSGLPEPIPNRKRLADRDFAKTVFSLEDARKYYFASVAHGLALEISGVLGWSIRGDSADMLAVIFDSRQFFEWDSSEGGYVLNEEREGLSTPSDPALIDSFLRSRHLIGKNRRETIERLIRWSAGLTHDFSQPDAIKHGFSRETAFFMERFWHYRGFPPALRVLEGSRQEMDSTAPDNLTGPRSWTAGCWGTSGLMRTVFRAINIPVEIRSVLGHASPHFLSEHVFLSHGDDPYNALFATLQKPLPAGDLLMKDSSWREVSGEPPFKQGLGPGFGAARLILARTPGYLVAENCRDISEETPPFRSLVLKDLAPYFSFQKLQAAGLWQRLKRESCKPVSPGLNRQPALRPGSR